MLGDLQPINPAYPVGSIGDQFLTCIQAGGDATSCASAVLIANPTASIPGSSGGISSWLVIGGIALVLFLMLRK